LGVATQGLNAAMIILCNREAYTRENLSVVASGGMTRQNVSSFQAPPPYDYNDFLNRRRVSTTKQPKKLESRASKTSFMVGDDDHATQLPPDTGQNEEPSRVPGRWIEPEDIIDPIGRGIKEFRPNPQLQNATMDMVNLMLPESVARPDESPACVAELPAPGPGEEWPDDDLQKFRHMLEIANQVLRHEQSISQLRAKMSRLTSTGMGISAPQNSEKIEPDSRISIGGRHAFQDEFARPLRPVSSQSAYPPLSGHENHINYTQGPGIAPPLPLGPPPWKVPSVSQSYQDLASQNPLLHSDSSPPGDISQHPEDHRRPPSLSSGLAIGSSQSPHTQMPYPTTNKSFSSPFQSQQSYVLPTQYPPLTYVSSAPAAPQAHQHTANQFSPYQSQSIDMQQRLYTQTPSYPQQADESQYILQPAYSHLTRTTSVPTLQPEQASTSRQRFPFFPQSKRPGAPDGPQSGLAELSSHTESTGQNLHRSYSSVASTHSYEPFDPTAVKHLSSVSQDSMKRLPPLPQDSVVSLASMSSLSLASTGTREVSGFDYVVGTGQAVNPNDNNPGKISGSGDKQGRSWTTGPMSRGRIGLEYRMGMADVDAKGPRGGR